MLFATPAHAKKHKRIKVRQVSKPQAVKEVSYSLRDAEYYFLIDADTKEVLLAKNADVRIAPSSMTKLMTAYVVFDLVRQGKVSLTSQCVVGKDAWHKSGSSMFLNYGDIVSIDQLVQGLLAVSGNDAAIALAESTAGGVAKFVALMNQDAEELGLKNSHFRNPHGLNESGHYMSLRDLAMLAVRLYQDFPQYSSYFGIPEFTYRNITQQSRNPLIRENYDGVVAGKTGYTSDGGYGVIGIVKRSHRRLIGVVNKAHTPRQRTKLITELFDYGFQHYKKVILFEKNKQVARLPVWLGSESEIEAVTHQEIAFNLPSNKMLDALKVSLKYKNPLYAPIGEQTKIAELVVEDGGKVLRYPLFAKEKIDKAGRVRRMVQILSYRIRNIFN